MMFLQYFANGAWFATAGLTMAHYGFSSIIGLTYSLVAIASIISPIFLGVIADRLFSSERVLGILQLLCGGLLMSIPHQLKTGHQSLFLILLFLYLLAFIPTRALTSNITFHNIENSERNFPIIRLFGTVGWMVAGIFIGIIGVSSDSVIFYISSTSSLLLGLYSFTLPYTPAAGKKAGKLIKNLLPFDAFKLFANRNFAIFMVCILLINIPASTYNSFTSNFLGAVGFHHVSTIMTIGQMLEVVFMLTIPFFLLRLGIKYMAFIGMAGWAIRLLLFAYGGPVHLHVLIILGLAMHGICIDFLMITGNIYVEKTAPKEVKAQAQSLFVLFSSGIGAFIGSLIAGSLFNSTVSAGTQSLHQWQLFWFIPAMIAVVIAIFFITTFKRTSKKQAALSLEVARD